MRSSDVVIAGAGIIGLSAALELADAGLSVTVLERGTAMREASWAAAGMLAADDPENPPQLRPLAHLSRSLYPAFLNHIEALSGIRVPLRTSMTLQGVAMPSGPHQLLNGAELHTLVPDLVQGEYFFFSLDERSLDPRDLCRALPIAVQAAGVTLCEHTSVRRIVGHGSGSRLCVDTCNEEFTATCALDCSGAWSVFGGVPVEPRKGQILAILMPPGAPELTCVLRTPSLYLVPRGEGRIVVGATVERGGFDRTVRAAASEELLAAAAAHWPPIRSGTVTECWTGLRPWTPDGLPILDALAEPLAFQDRHSPNLWAATGHFRNGVLLAPGTARVLRQRVLGEPTEIDLEPFSAARFATVQAAS